jgi:hypothetical protein
MAIYRGVYPSQLPYLDKVETTDIVLVKSGDTFYQTSVAAFRSAVDEAAQVSQADFEDAASSVNTEYKYPGRPRFDLTTGSWVWAQGSGSSAPWLNIVDDSVVYTPV